MMTGPVNVRPAGTAYPYSQRDYDHAGTQQANAALNHGRDAWRAAKQSHATTGSEVLVGVDGEGFGVSRFVRDRVVVHVGHSVSFSLSASGLPPWPRARRRGR